MINSYDITTNGDESNPEVKKGILAKICGKCLVSHIDMLNAARITYIRK